MEELIDFVDEIVKLSGNKNPPLGAILSLQWRIPIRTEFKWAKSQSDLGFGTIHKLSKAQLCPIAKRFGNFALKGGISP
ncbi:hypothetical protein HYU11_00360 [Candidatus Woesearchaeota archaeon]|nr:hypothetical protein [Candidatus Woesearchaeota archaeon]